MGASPATVSADAPCSRPQASGEILPSKRGVTSRCVASSRDVRRKQICGPTITGTLQPPEINTRKVEWPSRSCRGEGNRQRPVSEAGAGHSGGMEDGTQRQFGAEQERPSPAVHVGRGDVYKPMVKWRRAGRESEGLAVPLKAAINRWREGALLRLCGRTGVSVRAWLEPEMASANFLIDKARKPWSPLFATAKRRPPSHTTGSIPEPGDGLHGTVEWMSVRATCMPSEKTVGQPCAGNPHARLERGGLETGRR